MAEQKTTTIHLKMARASEEEMDALLAFFQRIDDFEYEDVDEEDMGLWLSGYLEEHRGLPFSPDRIIFGYRTMFANACDQDPAVATIEWKPEIHRALESQPELLAACETTLEWLEYHGYDESDSLIERLQTVIALAKPRDTAVEETATTHDHSTLYYIVNEAYSKNGVACFWKPNSSGYTTDVKKAGQYTRDECEKVRFVSDLLFLPVDQVTPEVCLMAVPDMIWLAHAQKLPVID